MRLTSRRRILYLLTALFAGGLVHVHASAAPPFTYENPLDFSYPFYDGAKERKITELRDPAIIREGDTYYLTFTVFPFMHSDSRRADKPDHNSAPGIMLYSSPDLKTWKFERWLVTSSELPDDCPYKHGFWASEIHKIRGRFFLIFTADNWLKDEYNKGGKIGAYVAFLGVADKVTGPFKHITWLKGRAATAPSSRMKMIWWEMRPATKAFQIRMPKLLPFG
jgi:beta-xylosidase